MFSLSSAAVRKVTKMGAITLLIVTSTIGLAPTSSALGANGWLCGRDQVWVGSSNNTGAYTDRQRTSCGRAGVRATYQITNGGTLYYAAWRYGDPVAASQPGNIIAGGRHTVNSCGFVYSCGPEST